MRLSDRARTLPESGIRKFFELAEARDDVISLGVGEPDFSAPWKARAEAVHSLERGRTSYTTNRGMYELREEIASHVERCRRLKPLYEALCIGPKAPFELLLGPRLRR